MPNVDISSTVTKKRLVQVDLVEAKVTDAYFIMSRDRVVLSIDFITPEGKIGKREHWRVKGDALNRALGDAPVGTSLLGALGKGLNDIVDRVENTEGLKDQLVATGELKIFSDARVSLEK